VDATTYGAGTFAKVGYQPAIGHSSTASEAFENTARGAAVVGLETTGIGEDAPELPPFLRSAATPNGPIPRWGACHLSEFGANAHDGGISVELDAIDPNTLRDLVQHTSSSACRKTSSRC
jgi:hypothetical protein